MIGDLVGSRTASDRRGVHRQLTRVLDAVATELPPLDPAVVVAGDELQLSYPRLGDALQAAFLIRLRLAPEIDVRFGIGWGTVEVLDSRSGAQDGPAWWQARSAIETVEARAQHPGTRNARFCYRAGPDGEGPDEPAVEAALICRDQLMGSLSTRSMRILGGLVAGRSKTEIARTEQISTSAVSQRVQRDGLDVIVAASAMLREVG
ncbi:RNA polymerase subunit sigma-70 [Microlunatus elymi]|uniref:RNA polymerase subunit sigma-70 n=1 Tax=Microlunatus elymi TaxID=2596828 RepID=A0A516PZQ3_9ACTN|nr:SatD family protein [Microlunatus elymi]QDP96663.1 RNA polymerase subunit sigma-70 [Microlunatus elymi]